MHNTTTARYEVADPVESRPFVDPRRGWQIRVRGLTDDSATRTGMKIATNHALRCLERQGHTGMTVMNSVSTSGRLHATPNTVGGGDEENAQTMENEKARNRIIVFSCTNEYE
jgi:hypothetical protein